MHPQSLWNRHDPLGAPVEDQKNPGNPLDLEGQSHTKKLEGPPRRAKNSWESLRGPEPFLDSGFQTLDFEAKKF